MVHAPMPQLDEPGSAPKQARQNAIAEEIGTVGFMSVDAIADAFQVSRMTVHRDLEDLHRQGRIRRVRGGASIVRSTQFERSRSVRVLTAAAEKRGIARAAAQFATDGDVIMLDDSTTCLELVPYLKKLAGVTIVSNYLHAIVQLAEASHVNLICTGGHYERLHGAFLGIVTEDAINSLAVDVLFMSTSSIRGTTLYHQDEHLAKVKRAMIQSAKQRLLLVDHSKVDLIALYKVAELAEFTHVVIDNGASAEAIDEFRATGVEVIVAEPIR